MKRFEKMACQGDVMFIRVNKLPLEATVTAGKVVAHSETGHHHSFEPNANVFVYSTPDELKSYLEVKSPAVLKHRRDFDTHEEILFDIGTYEIRRQREHSPEGWKRVED